MYTVAVKRRLAEPQGNVSRWLIPEKERKSPTRMRPAAGRAFKALGQRLRELRESRGESQEEAADRAGLSPKTLQDFERGVTNPTLSSILAVAQAYEVSLGELFRDL